MDAGDDRDADVPMGGSGAADWGDGDAGGATADDDAADDGEEEGDGGPPDPMQLRQRWHQEVALVKRLARQGMDPQHPAMLAAYAARDAAESEWRRHKDPAPLATRLGWAQRRFDKAVALQAKTRERIDDLERDFKKQKDALEERLDADRERVDKRRRELEEVQAEAGGVAPRARRGAESGAIKRACERTCDAMRKHVAPGLTALAEKLDTGSEEWTMLTAIVSALNESHDTLQQAVDDAAEVGAQRYDMADGDDDASEWSESHDLPNGDPRASGADAPRAGAAVAAGPGAVAATGAEAAAAASGQMHKRQHQHHNQHQQYVQQPQWGGCWQGQYYGQQPQPQHCHGDDGWQRGGPMSGMDGHGRHLDTRDDDAMAEEAWENWGHAEWAAAGAKWMYCGHGKWQRSTWADAWECEQMEQGTPAEEEDADAPQRKNRRIDEQPAQQQLHQQSPAAPAMDAGAGSAASDAARAHDEMLSCIIARAMAAGIQPITQAGEELQLLDTNQLAAWAAENLPQGQ